MAKTKNLTLAAKRALKARQAHAQRSAKERSAAGTASTGSITPTTPTHALHHHGAGVTSKVKSVTSSRTSSIHHSRSKPTSRVHSRAHSPAGAVSFAELGKVVGELTARQPYPSPSPSAQTLSPEQPLLQHLAPEPYHAPAPQPQPQPSPRAHRFEHDRGRSTTPRLLWRSKLEAGTADALEEYVQVRFGQPGIPSMSCSGEPREGRRRRPTEAEADRWARELARTGL